MKRDFKYMCHVNRDSGMTLFVKCVGCGNYNIFVCEALYVLFV